MKIENAIVHEVVKERGKKDVSHTYREKELDHSDQLTDLLDRVRKLYNDRTGKAYGGFGAESNLAGYFDECEQGDRTFLQFTTDAMGLLEAQLRATILATGGYMFFARYQENGARYLFVAMLKSTGGISFSDDLELLDVNHLDLDKLHLAARVHIPRWRAGDDHRYVSFVKGRMNQEVRQYFTTFLGVSELSDSAQHTRDLVKAVKEYCAALPPDDQSRIKDAVMDYGERQARDNEPIEITTLSAIINPEEPEEFLGFASAERFELQAEFMVDKKRLDGLRKIQGGDSTLKVAFDKELLGNTVKYVRKTDTLLIHPIPPNLRDQLVRHSAPEDE